MLPNSTALDFKLNVLIIDSVSEHAFALASALKRQILPMHQMTVEGKKWAEIRAPHLAFGQPPRTNAEETLVSAGLSDT
jgi:phosphoglycerate dehydrogenase-like enzyme